MAFKVELRKDGGDVMLHSVCAEHRRVGDITEFVLFPFLEMG